MRTCIKTAYSCRSVAKPVRIGAQKHHTTLAKKGKMSRTAFRPIPWSLLLRVFSSGSAFAMFDACCKALDCAHCLKQTFCIWLHKERIYSMFAPLQTVNTLLNTTYDLVSNAKIEQYAAVYTVSCWLLPKETDICSAFSKHELNKHSKQRGVVQFYHLQLPSRRAKMLESGRYILPLFWTHFAGQ